MMRLKSESLLYFAGIIVSCSSVFLLGRVMASTGHLSSAYLPVYQYALPIALLMQSAFILWAVRRFNDSRNWINADLAIISCIIVLMALSLTSPARALFEMFTGLIIGFSMFCRGIFLLSYTSKLAKRASSITVYAVIAWVIFSLLVPTGSWRVVTRPLMGDEPYYLLVSYSLIHDRNINLEDNYLRGDSLSFTDKKLSPQLFDSYNNGKLLSRHPPFLPLLLIPGFLIAGSAGAIYTMAFMGALLAMGLFRLLKQYKVSSDVSVWAAGITVLTAPLLFYSTALFTELPAALICIWIVSIVTDVTNMKKKPLGSTAVALGLTIAATALKTRFVVLCLPPVFIALLLRGKSRKKVLFRIGLILTVFLVIAIYNVFLFGSPLGRYNLNDIPGLSITRAYRGFVGLLLDQQYGLFPMNPLYLLSIPGIILLFKTVSRSLSLIWLATLLPYYTLVAMFAELSGGICPRGRFLVAWIPLLTVPASICYMKIKSFVSNGFFLALATVSGIVTFFLVAFPDWQIVYPGSADHILSSLSQKLDLDILHVIPSFDRVDKTLFTNSSRILLVILSISVVLFFIERFKKTPRTFGSVPFGFFLGLTGITTGFLTFSSLQTSWMDVEDKTFFFRGNTHNFWEEPYYWDNTGAPNPSPYISGARLVPGSSVFRKHALRPPSKIPDFNMAMEIVARASYPVDKAPLLEITTGNSLLDKIQIRSTDFKSYVIPWPYGMAKDIPQLGMHYSRYNDSTTYIDLDKLRLIPADAEWPERPHDVHQFFPVKFGPLTCYSFDFPDNIVLQGETFHATPDFSVNQTIDSYDFGLLFISETRGYVYPMDPDVVMSSNDLEIRLPAELGSGTFDVLLFARNNKNDGEFVTPEGVHAFSGGRGAWVGKLDIHAAAVDSQSDWQDVVHKNRPAKGEAYYFLPQLCHLSRSETIEIVPDTNQKIKGIVVISHLSFVFEQIDWETEIGFIQLFSENGVNRFDFVLGRQTAEELYEFQGKDVRLPHPQPPVAVYKERELQWPVEFEGMSYDAAFYIAVQEFDNVIVPEKIQIQSYDFPGVWNIYSLALILAP
jgi:hypothetical protein